MSGLLRVRVRAPRTDRMGRAGLWVRARLRGVYEYWVGVEGVEKDRLDCYLGDRSREEKRETRME